jgi:hypothetical protein
MRIPFNRIDINIININGKYEMQIVTKQMENQKGFEYSDQTYTIPITKTEFDKYYYMALEFNYKDMLIANGKGGMGMDGDSFSIKVGNASNFALFSFWAIDYKTEERKLTLVRNFIKEVYAKAGLDKWDDNKY